MPRDAPASNGFVFMLTLLVAVLVVALLAQAPASVAPTFLTHRAPALKATWPEGWGFFSDVAADDTVVAYQGDMAHGAVHRLFSVQADRKNLYGLGEAGLARVLEALSIDASLTPGAWHACTSDLVSCLKTAGNLPLVAVDSPALTPSLCGPIVLTEARPMSWSANLAAVTRFAELDVRCS